MTESRRGDRLKPVLVDSVWIDPSWLSWEPYWDTKDPVPNDNTVRLYKLHQHACDRLVSDSNEFDRIDAIMALRRVVGMRVKALMESYQLRELGTGAKPKHDLELLEHFGIIRPFMLRRLIDIRNIVEHQDSSPPSVDECLMFADLVWYLLRSTDGLAKIRAEFIIFRVRRGSFHQVILSFGEYGEHFSELDISALVDPSLVAYEPRENWIMIKNAKVTHSSKSGWVAVEGRVQGTEEQMKRIYDAYFRTSYLRITQLLMYCEGGNNLYYGRNRRLRATRLTPLTC